MPIYLLIQIVLSLVLIVAVVLQSKGGTGLGRAFGGGTSYHAKRGMEKTLFSVTVVTAVLFVLISIVNAF